MSWLRPAALYLTLTALIGGSIWLFWGKAIEQKWKQLSLEPTKFELNKARSAEKKLPAKTALDKKSPGATKATPREEWQKAQSGIIALIAIEAADNRGQLAKLGEFIDNRWYELLRRPRPAAVKPEPQRRPTPAEPQPSKQKVK